MRYGLNLGWGGPIGDYIGFWGRPSKGNTTHLVQGLHTFVQHVLTCSPTAILESSASRACVPGFPQVCVVYLYYMRC